MRIIKDIKYLKRLASIVFFIAKDKKSAAINFENTLEQKIEQILHFPCKHRKSQSFDDEAYRDLIYKGYTIIYKIERETIMILDIFKWQDR